MTERIILNSSGQLHISSHSSCCGIHKTYESPSQYSPKMDREIGHTILLIIVERLIIFRCWESRGKFAIRVNVGPSDDLIN